MTRKDFELIAKILRNAKPSPPIGSSVQTADFFMWNDIVDSFTAELAATNPLFDAQRFHSACNG